MVKNSRPLPTIELIVLIHTLVFKLEGNLRTTYDSRNNVLKHVKYTTPYHIWSNLGDVYKIV